MRNVPVIDATGLSALEWILDSSEKNGTKVIISGINSQPYNAITKAELNEKIGHDFICSEINTSIKRAKEFLKKGSADFVVSNVI